jgi:hypothetical protein
MLAGFKIVSFSPALRGADYGDRYGQYLSIFGVKGRFP